MSPEALARLREALALDDVDTGDFWLRDLRALLDAHDTARAEGVAAERARVVADLLEWCSLFGITEAQVEVLRAAADRYRRGEHDKEGA